MYQLSALNPTLASEQWTDMRKGLRTIVRNIIRSIMRITMNMIIKRIIMILLKN